MAGGDGLKMQTGSRWVRGDPDRHHKRKARLIE